MVVGFEIMDIVGVFIWLVGEEVVFKIVVEVYLIYLIKVLVLLVFKGFSFGWLINFCRVFLLVFWLIVIVIWIVFFF